MYCSVCYYYYSTTPVYCSTDLFSVLTLDRVLQISPVQHTQVLKQDFPAAKIAAAYQNSP